MNIIASINITYFRPFKVMLESLWKLGGLRKIETNLPNISAGRFPTSSLARIVAPFLLPEYIDKALYLDADILIRGSLDEFYYKDIKK